MSLTDSLPALSFRRASEASQEEPAVPGRLHRLFSDQKRAFQEHKPYGVYLKITPQPGNDPLEQTPVPPCRVVP
jgi:hypothetical protein